MTDQQLLILSIIKEIDKICIKNNICYSLAYGSVLGAVRHKGFIPWDSDIDIVIPLTSVELFRSCIRKELPSNMRLLEWEKEKNYNPCFDRVVIVGQEQAITHVDIFTLCGVPDEDKQRRKFINSCYFTYHFFCNKFKDPKYSRVRNRWKVRLLKLMLSVVPSKTIKKKYKKMLYRYDFEHHDYVSTLVNPYKSKDYMIKRNLLDTIRKPFEDTELPIPKAYDEYLSHIYGDYMTPRKY